MPINLTTPVARLVQGNLYVPNEKDATGKLLTHTKGPLLGQLRVEYFFAIAIPKESETHWSQTTWGQSIYKLAQEEYPRGQWQRPDFSWKIIDGDSTVLNNGTPPRRPCDITGFAGSWIMRFTNGFYTKIYNKDGTKELVEPNFVNPGDWVQVNLHVAPNKSEQTPGMYLNPSMIAFSGYGERIISGPAPTAVGFGEAPLPPGVKSTPPAAFVPPVEVPPAPEGIAPLPVPVPVPYPQILNVPEAPPARVMTPAANGLTYEQYKSAGWKDEQMIAAGLLVV